jgi:hypothetical protein
MYSIVEVEVSWRPHPFLVPKRCSAALKNIMILPILRHGNTILGYHSYGLINTPPTILLFHLP